MPIQSRAAIVYVKTEAVPGTGEAIAQGADTALRVLEWDCTPAGEGLIERVDHYSAYSGVVGFTRGSQRWDVKLVTELYDWSDKALVTSSPLSPLWAACGTLSTLGGPNRIRWMVPSVYTLGTTISPCTIEIHEVGGNRYRFTGCVGTVVVTADSGTRVRCEWTLHGMWGTSAGDPVASAFTQSAAVYGSAQLPEIFRVATTGIAPAEGLSSFSWTPGAVLTERMAAEATAAMGRAFRPSFVSRDNADVLAFTIDADDETTLPMWTAALATSSGAMYLTWQPGSTIWRLDLPAGVLRLPARQTGRAYRQYDLEAVGSVDPTTGYTSYLTVQ